MSKLFEVKKENNQETKYRYPAKVTTLASGDINIIVPASDFDAKEIEEYIPKNDKGNHTLVYERHEISKGLIVQVTVYQKDEYLQKQLDTIKKSELESQRIQAELEAEQTKVALELEREKNANMEERLRALEQMLLAKA